MNAETPLKLEEIARDNYAVFASIINHKYQLAAHIDIVIQMLEDIERGIIDRGMVSMPPRHSKSFTVTETFPAWFLGRRPDEKVIISGNTSTLTEDMGNKIRQKMLSPEFAAIFPDCKISKDTRAKDKFTTTAGGEFFAIGVGGALPGRGGHLICIDDPIKGREQADSDVQRKKIQTWYEGVLYNRQEPGARILLVSTRWHEDDLQGWLLNPEKQEQVEPWQVLNLPAIAEHDEGWRNAGDALWPARWPLEKLQRFKRNMAQRSWAALYQGRPSAIEGIEIKRSWFKYYYWNPYNVTRSDIRRAQTAPFMIMDSWDTAGKDGPENDYHVKGTWLITQSGIYLLDVVRKKMLTPEFYKAVKQSAIQWKPDLILIEDTANGTAVGQLAQAETLLPIKLVRPQGDKKFRMRGVSHLYTTGRVFHPVQAPWLKDYEDELVSFPTGAYDDQVDMTSQLLFEVKMSQYHEDMLNSSQDIDDINLFAEFDQNFAL